MIRIKGNRAFAFQFENGLTVSVSIGPGSYSSNYDANFYPTPNELGFYKSEDAEVAVLCDQQFLSTCYFTEDEVKIDDGIIEYGDVEGYLSPESVVKILNNVAKLDEKSVKLIKRIISEKEIEL